MAEGNPVALFRGKEIRKILHKDEWWFSVADVVAALTDTVDSRQYIKKIRQRDSALDAEWGTICTPLELIAPDGKRRETNCANTEGVFRIIQSMRSIHIREELTSEWKNRGVQEDRDYAILTAEISKAAFGITPSEYKRVKGIKRENLRDHMNDLELIFSMLGEAATTEITRVRDANGFVENRKAARQGGGVAGKARKELEDRTGKKIVSSRNFLPEPAKRQKSKRMEKP